MASIGSTDVIVIKLDPKEVPGAVLPHLNVETNSNSQLKRWLECRGLPRTGKRVDLIQRVKFCLTDSSVVSKIDPAIDQGKWYDLKLEEARRILDPTAATAASSSADHTSADSSLLWVDFATSGQTPPKCFNYGNIYFHIVESVQAVTDFILPTTATEEDILSDDEVEGEEGEGDMIDLHTSKPLVRGKLYFKSGHVQDLKTRTDSVGYFVKSRVMASYKMKVYYNVEICLSTTSGQVKSASCECKASAMGRCSHVSGVLLALLDFSSKFDKFSPTSATCTWNRGRQAERQPRKLADAEYDSKVNKRLKIGLQSYDPRPLVLREDSLDREQVNDLVTSLQFSSSRSNCSASMWELMLPLTYEDYDLDYEQAAVLRMRCDTLLGNLKVGEGYFATNPHCIVPEQRSPLWFAERSVRITASIAKSVANTDSQFSTVAIKNIILKHVWDSERFVSAAMKFGIDNEAVAREAYAEHIHGGVVETGLWIDPLHPEIAASPDGLVVDHSCSDIHGLVEIKCPYSLKDKDPRMFSTLLTKTQLSGFCLKLEGGRRVLKKSHSYYYQIQLQMAVTGRNWCDLVIWTSNDYLPLVIRIKKDLTFCQNLVQRLVKFHHSFVCPELFEMRTPRDLLPLKL